MAVKLLPIHQLKISALALAITGLFEDEAKFVRSLRGKTSLSVSELDRLEEIYLQVQEWKVMRAKNRQPRDREAWFKDPRNLLVGKDL